MIRTLISFYLIAFAAIAQTVTIGTAGFSGSGLNDATSGGSYTPAASNAVYVVTISATGSPDRFTWSKNGGAASPPVAITGTAQTLADGVTIKFAAPTGHRLNDRWTIKATAHGSLSGSSMIEPVVGAHIRNAEDKAGDTVSVLDFGAKGDYNLVTHSGFDNCAAFTAAGAIGGNILFPPGQYFSSCTITQSIPSHYLGSGRGNDCLSSPTCLIFASGVTGIVNSQTARASSVGDMWIQSLSPAKGTDNGIWVRDSWFLIEGVGVTGFGNDGIHAATDNVDHLHIDRSLLVGNKGDGAHCDSGDCNSMVWENSEALNNAAIGWHMGSGGTNHFFGLVATANKVADYDIGGISSYFDAPYCEGRGTFIMRGSNSWINSPVNGGCTITNPGGPSNTIILDSQIFNNLYWGPTNPAAANPNRYAWYSGNSAPGCADLWDVTNNLGILSYCPSTGNIKLNKTVAMPAYAGAGGRPVCFHADGTIYAGTNKGGVLACP